MSWEYRQELAPPGGDQVLAICQSLGKEDWELCVMISAVRKPTDAEMIQGIQGVQCVQLFFKRWMISPNGSRLDFDELTKRPGKK